MSAPGRREQEWGRVLELEERGDPDARKAWWRYVLRIGLPVELLGVAILGGLAAVNFLWFDAAGRDYLDWFIANGATIALIASVVTVAVDLDRNPGLIAANPLGFVAGVFRVFVELSSSLGAVYDRPRSDRALADAGLTEVQTRFRWRLFDYLVGNLFLLFVGVAMLAWALIVAPLQYAVNLVCGAPARMALASYRTVWRVQRTASHTEYLIAPKDLDTAAEFKGAPATELAFAAKPVTFTSAIAAVLLWSASQVV